MIKTGVELLQDSYDVTYDKLSCGDLYLAEKIDSNTALAVEEATDKTTYFRYLKNSYKELNTELGLCKAQCLMLSEACRYAQYQHNDLAFISSKVDKAISATKETIEAYRTEIVAENQERNDAVIKLKLDAIHSLQEQLSKFQTSEFHPDWSMLEACREGNRELKKQIAENNIQLRAWEVQSQISRDQFAQQLLEREFIFKEETGRFKQELLERDAVILDLYMHSDKKTIAQPSEALRQYGEEVKEKCAVACDPTNADDPADWTEYAKIKAACAKQIRELKL